jgi:hypothetical protein
MRAIASISNGALAGLARHRQRGLRLGGGAGSSNLVRMASRFILASSLALLIMSTWVDPPGTIRATACGRTLTERSRHGLRSFLGARLILHDGGGRNVGLQVAHARDCADSRTDNLGGRGISCSPSQSGRYRLRAEVATVQIHELASLRSSPISTDPLVGDDGGHPCFGSPAALRNGSRLSVAKLKQPHGPPMTLGNMRQLGVQRLIAFCLNNHFLLVRIIRSTCVGISAGKTLLTVS